jgi:hypothetical protein
MGWSRVDEGGLTLPMGRAVAAPSLRRGQLLNFVEQIAN